MNLQHNNEKNFIFSSNSLLLKFWISKSQYEGLTWLHRFGITVSILALLPYCHFCTPWPLIQLTVKIKLNFNISFLPLSLLSFLLASKPYPWRTNKGKKKKPNSLAPPPLKTQKKKEGEKKRASNNVIDNTAALLSQRSSGYLHSDQRAEASQSEPHARCATRGTGAKWTTGKPQQQQHPLRTRNSIWVRLCLLSLGFRYSSAFSD